MSRSLPILLATFGLLSSISATLAVTKAASGQPQNGAPPPPANGGSIGTAVHTPSAVEIVKLKEAGLDVSVIKAYIETARAPYVAMTEDILYLHEKKVPDEVIAAWMRKGSELSAQAAAARPPVPQNVQPMQPPAGNGQAPQVIYQAPPEDNSTVVYATPSYVYSDYYRPYWGYWNTWPAYYSWGWPYYWGGWYGYNHHHGGHYYAHYGKGYHGGYGHGGHGYRGGYGHGGGHGYRGGPGSNGGGWGNGYRAGYRGNAGYQSGGNNFAGAARYSGGGGMARPTMANPGFRGGGQGGGARFVSGGGGGRFGGGGGARFGGGGGGGFRGGGGGRR